MADDAPRGLAPAAMVETAEGPVPMHETPGKGFAVLTRLPSGQLGFRQLLKVTTREGVPLVRVTLDTGHAVLAARGQVFFREGMVAVPAAELRPGDRLETAFRYRDGYVPTGTVRPVATAVAVKAVERAGEGSAMSGTVRDTHTLFLTAGVLCGE
jgi:hypothetical protein